MNYSIMTRREALKTVTLGTLGCSTRMGWSAAAAEAVPGSSGTASAGPFVLPPFPYAFDALEPYIDAQTMQIHHDKHHAAYVANLNKALAEVPALAGKPIEAILRDLEAVPESIRTTVRNNGGGHANHTFFWPQLKNNQGRGPSGELARAIDKRFGDFAGFQLKFTEAATRQFGSGWAWLTIDPDKQLTVESTPNQDTPLSKGRTPLVGIDVWEHAYYLRYQNRRPEYIAAFYHVVDWDVVADRFRNATS